MNRKDIFERKSEIDKWIIEGKPKNFICKKLKCRPTTLNSWLKKMGIDYKGKIDWANGKKFPDRLIPVENYLKKDSIVHSDTLKRKLIRDGYKEKKCEKCGITTWNDVEAPLELHHIDGDRHNNELSNLQILCPNCHAQTNNFNRIKEFILNGAKERKKNKCQCGKLISIKSIKCKSCAAKVEEKRKVKNRPSKEELIEMIKETSLEAVGRKYGVTGNAVKKWLK